MKIELTFTNKEMNVMANALNSKRKQLEHDIKFEYTPDTKEAIRKMLRKELKAVNALSYKIQFVKIS